MQQRPIGQKSSPVRHCDFVVKVLDSALKGAGFERHFGPFVFFELVEQDNLLQLRQSANLKMSTCLLPALSLRKRVNRLTHQNGVLYVMCLLLIDGVILKLLLLLLQLGYVVDTRYKVSIINLNTEAIIYSLLN